VITLNHRDSRRLKEVYGVTATAELPTSFSDTYDENKAQKLDAGSQSEITYLFVGRAFFANVEGVQWFITNVLPNIKGTLYVVGSGMDKDAFADLTNRVKILGYVDNLSEVYYKARFVVSPILSGAGMKTKTAEALMFGKTIIGTTEAFEGYELTDGATYLCNTADEWISTINRLKSQSSNINLVSRSLFKKNHCTEALIEVLAQVIKL
jgi:glycosyltransferase involved in cell wall biosynthesis